MQRSTIIAATASAALVLVLLLTVLSKRWWVQRIRAKWNMTRWVLDPVLNRWVLETMEYRKDLSGYTLKELINDYRNGQRGWSLLADGDIPVPVNTTMFNSPLGPGIVDNRNQG